jgi:tetratricopeptide (TPR) repeat protein
VNRWEVHRRADDLLDLRRPQAAEELLRAHLAEEPEDAAALLLLCQALRGQGRDREAEDAARAAVRLEPESHQAHLTLCDVLVTREDAEGAMAAAQEALRLGPQQWSSHYAHARALLAGRRPRVRDALDVALHTVGMAPHSASAHNLVGICFDALNQPDQARRAFEEALRLDPQHVNAQANLAGLDAEQGRLRRSAQRVTAALGQHPQEEHLHDTLDLVMARFARRLLWVVLGGAVVTGVLLAVEAAYPVRALAGLGLAVGVGLLVRSFLEHLPSGVRSVSALPRALRGWTRWGVLVLVLAVVTVVLMSWAPYDVAVVAGLTLLTVLRVGGYVLIAGALLGALRNLVRGR